MAYIDVYLKVRPAKKGLPGKMWNTQHKDDPTLKHKQLITISSVTYTFALVTAKASLAALYLNVFRGRSCLLQTLNQGLLLFFVCEAVEETAVVTSQCLPAIGAWSSSSSSGGSGTCVNLKPFWWTTVRRETRLFSSDAIPVICPILAKHHPRHQFTNFRRD